MVNIQTWSMLQGNNSLILHTVVLWLPSYSAIKELFLSAPLFPFLKYSTATGEDANICPWV